MEVGCTVPGRRGRSPCGGEKCGLERTELSAHAHQAGIQVLFVSPLPAMLTAAGITAGVPSMAAGSAVWLVGQVALGLALVRGRARFALGAALVTAAALVAVGVLAPGPSLFVALPAVLMVVAALALRRLAAALDGGLPRASLRSGP